MENKLFIYDYIIIILLLCVSVAIGLYFRFTGGKQKTIDEFLMGSKKMTVLPVSFSLMATYMSAIAVLGIPAETYMYGSQHILYNVGFSVGSLIVSYGFLPVYFDMKINTSYEYLEKRFGKTTRAIVSFLFILQMIFYIAVVLYAPSTALNAITGLPTWATALSMAFVSMLYCSLGGMKAVLWTDVFQSVLMYVTVAAIIIGGTYAIGFLEVFTVAADGGRLIFFNFSVDMTDRYTFWNSFISGIYLTMTGYGASQSEIQRILSVGELKKGQIAVFLSAILIIIFQLICVWAGIVLYAIYENCDPMLNPDTHLQSPDQFIPYTVIKLFGALPGLSGLCIAGIFSASLSTISSAINSLTSVTVEDFLKPYCHLHCVKESGLAFIAKLLALVYGGFCLVLTFMIANFRGLMEASGIMFGMIGGPTVGIFLIGLFSKNANQSGALFGLLAGCGFSAWAGFGSYVAKVKIPTLKRSISGCREAINETISLNDFNNSAIDSKLENAMLDDLHQEKYTFPLYKLSFVWIPIFGCLTVVIVGCFFSLITGVWIEKTEVHPEKLSPFVRKLYYRTKPKKKLNTTISQTNLITKMENLQQSTL